MSEWTLYNDYESMTFKFDKFYYDRTMTMTRKFYQVWIVRADCCIETSPFGAGPQLARADRLLAVVGHPDLVPHAQRNADLADSWKINSF